MGGISINHSILVIKNITSPFRFITNLSQIINPNITTPTALIADPIVDNQFQ